MAMKPGAASESWPEYRTMNIDAAMMLLMPICAIKRVCEFQNAMGSETSWMKQSTSDFFPKLRAEEALRPQDQHQEERSQCDAATRVASKGDNGANPDEAQQVAADHRPRHPPQPPHHDALHPSNLAPPTATIAPALANPT